MLIIAREECHSYGDDDRLMLFPGAIADIPDEFANALILEGKAYKFDPDNGPDKDYIPGSSSDQQ